MKLITVLLGLFCTTLLCATDIRNVNQIDGHITISTPDFLTSHEHPFYGLAFIYNVVQPIYILNEEVVYLDPEADSVIPDGASHVGWKGRYQVAMVSHSTSMNARMVNNELVLDSEPTELETYIGLPGDHGDFEPVLYSHLWWWLKYLALAIQWILTSINALVGHWGWSVICLSVVMKLLLMPVNFMTLKFQRNVSKYQTLLAPQLAEIKQKYSGEKAHNKLMQAHKDIGITPFYSLKPLFSNLILQETL